MRSDGDARIIAADMRFNKEVSEQLAGNRQMVEIQEENSGVHNGDNNNKTTTTMAMGLRHLQHQKCGVRAIRMGASLGDDAMKDATTTMDRWHQRKTMRMI
jgi:hypothetical protein